MAAVTDHHKLGDAFTHFHLLRSEIQNVSLDKNQGARRAVLPLETLGKNQFPCLCQRLELYSLHSLAPSSIFKTSSIASCFTIPIEFCLWSQISVCLDLERGFVIKFRDHLDDPG